MFVAKKSPRNKENCPPDIKPITYPRRLKRLDSSFSIDSSLNESMESLTNILTETTNNLSVSGCFDTSRVEDSSQCFNGNFKRRKSVRFDEENNSLHDDMPLPLKRKDSITKNPVPILKKKTSLDGSVRDNSASVMLRSLYDRTGSRQPAKCWLRGPPCSTSVSMKESDTVHYWRVSRRTRRSTMTISFLPKQPLFTTVQRTPSMGM